MSSKASDFRSLTPLVLMDALISAGTRVYEPIQRFTLELPADRYGPVLPVLARLGAVPDPPVLRGSVCVVTGDLPSARVHELQQLLPTLSRGEGMLDTEFDRYERVHGPVPRRSRSDLNPLNRKEYLLNLTRRR
jgi:ribosomal protection tetracycline resistance protein